MKLHKNFWHILAYDLFNQSFNIVSVLFCWSISHTYTLILAALFFARMFSHHIFSKRMAQQQEDYKQKVIEEMQSFQKKMEAEEHRKKSAEAIKALGNGDFISACDSDESVEIPTEEEKKENMQ